ncbi:hypothetical protein ACTMTI_47545 [Nonomuraea sp. H19]|uniref:hypothetical protein n=1 Tax=Nonomuraea sp. H19 TaxID=3452206 RepID=UPI003F89A9DB
MLGDVPQRPATGLASWNGLLATAHDLAVRAGWTGQDHTASWTLSARPSAVPSAQRMTATQLAAWQLGEHAGAAQRLVGEFVTDALDNGADKIRLTVSAEDGLLRFEIADAAHPARPPHHPALERLACCWGVAGTTVWFELRS